MHTNTYCPLYLLSGHKPHTHQASRTMFRFDRSPILLVCIYIYIVGSSGRRQLMQVYRLSTTRVLKNRDLMCCHMYTRSNRRDFLYKGVSGGDKKKDVCQTCIVIYVSDDSLKYTA
jgi:hypothetical protein